MMSAEKRLLQDLLSNYETVTLHGRPVRDINHTVHVKFGIGLIQMELDEKEKALSLSLWSKMVWEDEYLQWKPEDYGGLTVTKLDARLLWIPDIMLYNTAETETPIRETQAMVFHNGTVIWTPHQKLKSSCSIDVTNFPFDHQKCHMWFGSWTYTTRDINLTMAFKQGLDMGSYTDDFQDSNQFEILELIAERRVLPSTDEEPNYAVLTYTLQLRRNIVFASYILTLPCVFLACLTLVVFWLPPDRPDRTALAMSIFGSFLILLLILVEYAPSTSTSVPLLGVYYCFNMVIIMLAIFLSSLVVNICRLGENKQPVPKWMRKVFLEGPLRCLCVCNGLLPTSHLDNTESQHTERNASASSLIYRPLLRKASSFPYGAERNGMASSHDSGFVRLKRLSKKLQGTRDSPAESSSPQSCHDQQTNHILKSSTRYEYEDLHSCQDVSLEDLISRLAGVSQAVNEIENCVIRTSSDSRGTLKIERDWTNIAIILDRAFFISYVAIIILSISFLFPRP